MLLQRIPLQRIAKTILAPAIALLCAGAIGFVQLSKFSQLTTDDFQTQTTEDYLREEAQTKASLALLKQLPSLGFDNLIADWVFLNFLQYFGDNKARPKTGYQVTPDFFEVIVDRDPNFIDMYPYLSSSVSLFAGHPEKTVSLIAKGLESMTPQTHPDAYYLWRFKATDELLFLGDSQAAKQSFETAAEWASQSSNPKGPASAEIARRTAQFLAQNPDSKRAQVSAWFNIVSNAIDDNTRQRAIQQIKALGGEILVRPNGGVSVKLPPED